MAGGPHLMTWARKATGASTRVQSSIRPLCKFVIFVSVVCVPIPYGTLNHNTIIVKKLTNVSYPCKPEILLTFSFKT